ncbi:hypothetical protein BH18ACT1_BH18ACT1_11490 [soil metagenome]|nr:hypothetical protein [Acidimicrobiia bacterium]
MLVDIRTFRLVDGTGEGVFLEADARASTERNPLKGFLRRTTARGADERWLVLTFWRSAADADAAGPEAPLVPFVDASSERTQRYTTLD